MHDSCSSTWYTLADSIWYTLADSIWYIITRLMTTFEVFLGYIEPCSLINQENVE